MGKPTFDNSYCGLSMQVLMLHYELSHEGIET